MGIYKAKDITKDGKQWYFKIRYEDLDGSHKQKRSGRFATKKEAETAEFAFKLKLHNHENQSTITFEQMIDLFIEYKKDKVKETTFYNYGNKKLYLKPLYKIRLKEFNIMQFESWKTYINGTNLSTKYKNDIYKFLKSIMNYATAWYEFNFVKVYPKMTNFNDPNEIKKEMSYFTYEEFKLFLEQAEDIRWKTTFEILYYCGLRRGEIRALTWKDINFKNKTLSVNKQLTDRGGSIKDFHFSTPKTKSSIRTIPLTKVLLDDLKKLKEETSKIHGFSDAFFVCGDAFPVSSNSLLDHNKKYAKMANLHQIRLHDFRHSCASLLINKGANVTIVARYLGHSKLEETLNTYSHMFTGAMNEVVNLIDNLNEES